MTIRELLGCYTETMNKDSLRIYIQNRPENCSRILLYQKPICELDEAFYQLVVTNWFATPYANNETEITVFVTEDSVKEACVPANKSLFESLNPEEIDFSEQTILDIIKGYIQ